MIDREEVVREWEAVLSRDPLDAPWDLIDDTLTLLKEQEAVEPIKKDTVEITAQYKFDCPCGAPLLIGQPYCAGCGKAVKWND